MSADMLLEGFLRKRRDKMKMKWVTYWFRLETTSLYFYSKKNGRAIHLRGQYFLCMVESVREVDRAESKRYVFEIMLKNGKKKVLAAESAHLRQSWVESLWKAMHQSSVSAAGSAPSWQEAMELRQEAEGSPVSSAEVHDSHREDDGTHLTFSSGLWDCMAAKEDTQASDIYSDKELTACRKQVKEMESHEVKKSDYETLLPSRSWVCDSTDDELDDKEETEDYYDVPGNRAVEDDDIYVMEEEPGEAIYDVPLCHRNGNGFERSGCREFTESIYDVPKSLLRKFSIQSLEDPSGVEKLDHDDIFLYNQKPKVRRDSSAGWTTVGTVGFTA